MDLMPKRNGLVFPVPILYPRQNHSAPIHSNRKVGRLCLCVRSNEFRIFVLCFCVCVHTFHSTKGYNPKPLIRNSRSLFSKQPLRLDALNDVRFRLSGSLCLHHAHTHHFSSQFINNNKKLRWIIRQESLSDFKIINDWTWSHPVEAPLPSLYPGLKSDAARKTNSEEIRFFPHEMPKQFGTVICAKNRF